MNQTKTVTKKIQFLAIATCISSLIVGSLAHGSNRVRKSPENTAACTITQKQNCTTGQIQLQILEIVRQGQAAGLGTGAIIKLLWEQGFSETEITLIVTNLLIPNDSPTRATHADRLEEAQRTIAATYQYLEYSKAGFTHLNELKAMQLQAKELEAQLELAKKQLSILSAERQANRKTASAEENQQALDEIAQLNAVTRDITSQLYELAAIYNAHASVFKEEFGRIAIGNWGEAMIYNGGSVRFGPAGIGPGPGRHASPRK